MIENWIETSIDKPVVGEYVLLLLEGETMLKGRLNSNGWSAFFRDGEKLVGDREVTHWMYLPALPKNSNSGSLIPNLIRFNYYPGGTDHDYPERYEERIVGVKGVIEIKEHASQGEGDKWYWDIHYSNNQVERIFNPYQIFYSNPQP